MRNSTETSWPVNIAMICGLNQDHALDGERGRLAILPAAANRIANSAILACLGSPDGRARVLQALTDGNDADVKIAEVFLVHRPIDDVAELRDVASGIARMQGSPAQVRALDTLGRHRLRDRETLAELARLFPIAQSIDVQRAIAGVIIRSDYQLLPMPEMVSMDRSRSTASELMPPDTNVTPDGAVATSSLLAVAAVGTSDTAHSVAAASAAIRRAHVPARRRESRLLRFIDHPSQYHPLVR